MTFADAGIIKWLVWKKNNVRIKGNLDWKPHLEIGANTFIDCSGGVRFEGDNKIGYNSTILSYSTITTDGKPRYGPVTLEKNASVGANCVVLPETILGHNSILAAGSVARENIPRNEIWGGVPAKFIKKRNEG